MVHRPWWQKALIAASAIPIALGCNIARIAGTGVLHETVGHELADRVFHDLAGWLMMPAALGVLWVGLRVLDRVFVPVSITAREPAPNPAVVGSPARPHPAAPAPALPAPAFQTAAN